VVLLRSVRSKPLLRDKMGPFGPKAASNQGEVICTKP